jgi:uncharacterized protein DUF3147
MKVTAEFSRLRQTGWAEYALRFVFGGVVTVITGWIAQRFGPVIGGLFLSFPAIFPASVTLVERHEQRRKAQHGLAGKKRGRSAAGVVAAGAALGSLGLFTFAAVVWTLVLHIAAWEVLLLATVVWFAVSGIAWMVRQKL